MKKNVGVGDRFYSDYFKSCGTVVKYVDDNNWWFVLDHDNRKTKARANAQDMKWIQSNNSQATNPLANKEESKIVSEPGIKEMFDHWFNGCFK